MFKYKSTGILLLICLSVISWDKHGVPLSSKHNLGQTAHEHSSENQIYQILSFIMKNRFPMQITGGPDVVCVTEWIYDYPHGQINTMSRRNSHGLK